jgi:hypothetical protein
VFSVPFSAFSTRLAVLGGALALALAASPDSAAADVVAVDLVAKHHKVKIADGVKMKAWTFNDTVPGPVIRATEGDTIEVSLRNADHHMAHSVDFHAAQISPQIGFSIGMGLYGAIVVDPVGSRPPANETVLVQSEFYGKVKKGNPPQL